MEDRDKLLLIEKVIGTVDFHLDISEMHKILQYSPTIIYRINGKKYAKPISFFEDEFLNVEEFINFCKRIRPEYYL